MSKKKPEVSDGIVDRALEKLQRNSQLKDRMHEKRKPSRFIIEGSRVLSVIPELACEVGLEKAIILQQLSWLLENPSNGKQIGVERWIYNTYEQWQEQYFPWMSARTIQRYFLELERSGHVKSIQPEEGISRRKYYCLGDRGYDIKSIENGQ